MSKLLNYVLQQSCFKKPKQKKEKKKKKSKCPQSAAFALGMESQIMDWTFSKAELSLSSLTNSACGIW